MDTVSYLTINDETKEIADIASRDTLANISAIITANGDDIEFLKLETSSGGNLMTAISDSQAMSLSAQINAAAAAEAAALADEKAVSAGQAADVAWGQANSASIAANEAWTKAEESGIAAEIANQQATSATDAATTAWAEARSAKVASSEALAQADSATNAANQAWNKAEIASMAANSAQSSARTANTYAIGALEGLSTLESVIDTVNWFADHRTPTTDTTVNLNKNYYIFNSETGTMSKVEPDGIENPSEEGWYELDETIQNYVASHVAETNDGLYVLSTASGWRVLVSTGGGNYAAGVFIVDPQGVIKQAATGDGISFDNTTPFTIGDENAYIVFDGNGHITLGGEGVDILSSVSIGGSNKTLSQVLNDLGSAITAIEYGVGISSTSHSDIEQWSTASPEWLPDHYVWQRTKTADGLHYTYTCIQGAQGPQGDSGEQGEAGFDGTEGVGIVDTQIEYAISLDNYLIPEDEAWKDAYDDLGTIEQGSWLWVRTTIVYSDGATAATYQKSYIGIDGKDGHSVVIQSINKQNGITTVTFVDEVGNTQTMTIEDGKDGQDGTPGVNGYIHIAWANSADGTVDFSTHVSANKRYMGIYTSTESADSTNAADYSWTLIKGEDGKSLNIQPDIYEVTDLPSINTVADNDAYLVYDEANQQYNLYIKGIGATTWTIIEGWGGQPGEDGKDGEPGPEAVVTVTTTAINWATETATLTAILRVNGVITTPTSYKWTEGTSNTSLGTAATLNVTNLNKTYNCTVTW